MCVAKTFSEPSDPIRVNPASLSSASLYGSSNKSDWHASDVVSVVRQLATDALRGLNTAEVHERQLRYGWNALQTIRPPSAWRLFIDQFKSIVIALLAVAAGVAWIILNAGDRVPADARLFEASRLQTE